MNFSADPGRDKESFFKPRQTVPADVHHISFTVKIQLLHNNSNGSSRAAPRTWSNCSDHHRNWHSSGMIQRFYIRLSGLLHATGIRNDNGYATARQQGSVLITGLIFLVILTLLGTTALRGTLLEEKMAGNLRDETLAFQAAEAALRSGEIFLEQVTIPEFNGSDGLYHHADSPAPDPVNWAGWGTIGRVTADIDMDGVASQPRYIIEQLPSIPSEGKSGSAQQSGTSLNASMFRIIARGVGGNEATAILLQSTYRR